MREPDGARGTALAGRARDRRGRRRRSRSRSCGPQDAPTRRAARRRRRASASASPSSPRSLNRVLQARPAVAASPSRSSFVLIPPLALIFLVLGTIFLGVATPTEGGAMGAAGALIMALAQAPADARRCCKQAMDSTAKLSAFVVFILIGARVFSLTFYGVNGHIWVEHLLTSLPGGAGRLPDRRQHPGLRARLLPRLLRARLHHRAAAGAGRPRSSAST